MTDADRTVERALRERIARSRPNDAVFGEEEGDEQGDVRWVIDPIDGTKNFSRGVRVWATLIALERQGELVCGVMSAPALSHRWWAARREGAFRDGEPIHVSSVSRLGDASVSATYARDLAVVENVAWHARSLGDFWQHALVAEGSTDAAVDARLAAWDYGALVPIVRKPADESARWTAVRRDRSSRSSVRTASCMQSCSRFWKRQELRPETRAQLEKRFYADRMLLTAAR